MGEIFILRDYFAAASTYLEEERMQYQSDIDVLLLCSVACASYMLYFVNDVLDQESITKAIR